MRIAMTATVSSVGRWSQVVQVRQDQPFGGKSGDIRGALALSRRVFAYRVRQSSRSSIDNLDWTAAI
jgi:hypothetical protein